MQQGKDKRKNYNTATVGKMSERGTAGEIKTSSFQTPSGLT